MSDDAAGSVAVLSCSVESDLHRSPSRGHRRSKWSRTIAGRFWRPTAVSVAMALVLPTVLLVVWHQSATRGWISPLILPSPVTVWQSFCELWADHTIQGHLAVSAFRVAKGFVLGSVVGLALGTAFGLSEGFRAYVRPTFLSVYQVNILGWMPFFMLLFGIDEALKVVAIAWATALPVAVNTMQGIAGISSKWFELARVHELGRYQVLRWIVAPAALVSIFTGLRTGLGAAWMSLVVAELVASSEGIGFMVVWGRQLFQLDVVVVAIVMIGIVGLTLDVLLRGIERRIHSWRRVAI